jgi:hypothetical protein
MFYALNWFVVFSLFALWSLTAWAFHAVAGWVTSNTGVISSGSEAVAAAALPAWISAWVPAEVMSAITSSLLLFKPVLEGLLAMAPALAGGLSVVIWVIWGLGAVVLIVLGLLGSGLIALLKRQSTKPGAGLNKQSATG